MKQVDRNNKQVVIDSKKGIVEVDGKPIPPLLLGIMRGGVGKCFVVKHYSGRRKKKGRGIVVTRFPDMSGIVASDKQRERRDLFKEAVVYAKWIVGDEERKKAFRKTLPRKRRKHVYQAAIRLYMSMQGDPKWLKKQLAVKAMMRSGQVEWGERYRQWAIDNMQFAMGNGLGLKMVNVQSMMVHGFEQPGCWKVMWCKKENCFQFSIKDGLMQIGQQRLQIRKLEDDEKQ